MDKLPSFVNSSGMGKLHNIAVIRFIFSILFSVIIGFNCLAQCPGNCQITVKIEEQCAYEKTLLKAETTGQFLGWTTSEEDTSTIENKSLAITYVSPTRTTNYTATAQFLSENLLQNGSFDSNEQLFTTEYKIQDTSEFTTGNYQITKDPQEIVSAFVSKDDHSKTNGYMLVVDGSEDTSKSFFIQKIQVIEGHNYQFQLYAANIHEDLADTTDDSGKNSAKIALFINDVYLKSKSLSHDTAWNVFTYKWKSDFTGETTLKLKDKSSKLKENDFVVDDIFFGQVYTEKATITLEPCTSPNTSNDVFSPDGDGSYDTYLIDGNGVAKIYNSNGKLINTLQIPNNWDGKTSQGKNAPSDYYSIIINGTKVKHVTLVR